jgi:hypothetical protein
MLNLFLSWLPWESILSSLIQKHRESYSYSISIPDFFHMVSKHKE